MERVRAPGVRVVQRAPAGEAVIEELGPVLTGPLPGARLMRAAAVLAAVFIVWWVAGDFLYGLPYELGLYGPKQACGDCGPRDMTYAPGTHACVNGFGQWMLCPD